MRRRVLFLVFLAGAVPAIAEDPLEQLAEALTSQAEGKLAPPKLVILPFKCDKGVAKKDGLAAARSLSEHLKNLGRFDVLVGESKEKAALQSAFQNENGPDLDEVARLGKTLGVGGVVTGELEPEPDGGVVVNARIIRASPFDVVAGASWRIPWASRSDFSFRPVSHPASDSTNEFSTSGPIFSFNASIASRTDDFHWNIAGDSTGQNPNILSELTWKDIRIEELRLEGEVQALPMSFQGYFSVGRITGGKNQDSDYAGDNRSYEFSRSNNSANLGRTQDYRFSMGLPMGDSKQGRVTPRLGWAQASESLFMTNGFQTVAVESFSPYTPGPTGAFSGLDSHYDHRWRGILLGVDADTKIIPRLEVAGAFRFYPQLNYLADADWNLRLPNGLPPSDPNYDPGLAHPKSFEHTANGKGWDLDLSAFYDLNEGMDFGVVIGWRHWRAANGTDRSFFPDGTYSDTRLNEVLWNSASFEVAFRFRPTDIEPEPN